MFVGKALVNSVNGKDRRLLELLPIVKKYGAAVIGLCLGEEMPDTAAKRLAIARKIMDASLDHRIARNNLIVDPAALAIATDANSGREVLNAVRLIREQLGLPVSLGVSNTSFGLPQRALVHNAFLVQAIGAGLDAAILNPLDEQIHDLVAAASLFVGRDPDCRNYLKAYRARKQAEKG
jgi:5-methyltetrahydrofolate--homocysteine methyltransferase